MPLHFMLNIFLIKSYSQHQFKYLINFYRVKRVQTLEELRDCYQHFLLHYGVDIPKMRNMEKRKKNDEENNVEEQPQDEPVDSIKQATRKTGYDICLQAKLGNIHDYNLGIFFFFNFPHQIKW